MILNHFKELLRPWLNGRVCHEHHLHQLSNQIGVSDVVLVAQHHNKEHHNVLSAGLIKHLRSISAEKEEKISMQHLQGIPPCIYLRQLQV